jgi:hypothetical protein
VIVTMSKSFMMAAGIFACVLGVEMLLVDSAVITSLDGSTQPRTVTAPDWAPWTLISLGAVTILHFGNLKGPAPAVTKPPMGGHW